MRTTKRKPGHWEGKALKLTHYMSSQTTVECHFCGESYTVDSADHDSPEGFALHLYAVGWREVNSRYFQVIAAACPACATGKDKDRGGF
jgi:hypothetical protein